VGQKERDDTRPEAASANVVPLWPASSRDDLPTGYLEQVARRVQANLTDLVATADTYNLELATEFRIAAELLQQPSGTSHPLAIAESTGLRLTNLTGGCWELVDHNGNVLGLIVAIDGRPVLARTSWSRREVLAASGAVLLAPFAGLGAKATTAFGGDTSSPPDPEAAARLDYVMQHPASVDLAAAAHLREQAQALAKQYDLAASTSLLPAAGECSGQVTFLGKRASDGPVLRELQATEAQLATLMGQLVWDASQRRDHATAVAYYDQAISAANRAGETTAEAYARLRKSYVALYGEQEPQTGLRLAQQAATLADTAGSHALQGLALLHVGEGHAMLGGRRDCEAAVGAAEAHLQAMQAADPAHALLSSDRLGRMQGSCYLTLGDSAKAGSILESTARRLQGRHKSKAIILGNLALAHVRQRDVEQATTVLHRAIDLLEVSRGGGGLNVVSTAVRELHPWHQESVVQDVHERLLALMTLNQEVGAN
jgi:tetratricopeptide (TPR) repeat protein